MNKDRKRVRTDGINHICYKKSTNPCGREINREGMKLKFKCRLKGVGKQASGLISNIPSNSGKIFLVMVSEPSNLKLCLKLSKSRLQVSLLSFTKA